MDTEYVTLLAKQKDVGLQTFLKNLKVAIPPTEYLLPELIYPGDPVHAAAHRDLFWQSVESLKGMQIVEPILPPVDGVAWAKSRELSGPISLCNIKSALDGYLLGCVGEGPKSLADLIE